MPTPRYAIVIGRDVEGIYDLHYMLTFLSPQSCSYTENNYTQSKEDTEHNRCSKPGY